MQVATAVLVAVALSGGACSGDEPTADPTTTVEQVATSTGPAPTTTGPRTTSKLLTDVDAVLKIDGDRGYTPEQLEIVRAYVRAEQASLVAQLSPVDPHAADLVSTMTGSHLAQVQRVFAELGSAGNALSEPEILRIVTGRLVPESSTRVQIESCYITDAHVYETGNGRLLEPDAPYAIRRMSAMEQVDGTWRLASQGEVKSWPGIQVCLDPLS